MSAQDLHGWLDRVIEEQRRVQGAAADLINEVAQGPLPVGEDMDDFEREVERDRLREDRQRIVEKMARDAWRLREQR